MTKESKEKFILRKTHLSLQELSAQTGLSEGEVAQILEKEGSVEVSVFVPAFLQGGRGTLWVCGILLVLAVIGCYLPVLGNDFVNWDDKDFIMGNPLIRRLDGRSVWMMFTTFPTGNWMPLTWFSFALNFLVNGLDPRIFHATNVLFHALNTLLVFLVCLRLWNRIPGRIEPGPASSYREFGLPIAFWAALLFGLHPIHVESVAWATERKDVLYSIFYLGALWLYLGGDFSWALKRFKYWACLGLYLLALMSKPMAVTLPLVFLILDYWPLGRWRPGGLEILKEKTLFFVLALGAIFVTIASHEKTLSYAKNGVEFYWVMNSFRSLVFYLLKMILPLELTAYYPFPPEISGIYLFENFLAAVLVFFVSFLLFRYRRKAPFLLAAWLYYVVVLLPVIGIIQTGSQAAADRYTYLASLGFFLPFAAGMAQVLSYRWIPYAGLVIFFAALLGWGTVGQIGTWKNSQDLWQRVTEVYPDENPTSYSRLGAAYLKAHRYDEALSAFIRASAIPPPLATTFNDLGKGLLYKDRVAEAIGEFEYALALDPKFIEPRENLWKVFEREGKHEEAVGEMLEALKIEPNTPDLYNNLGVSYGILKKYGEARVAFQKAYQLDRDNPEYLVNLATICLWQGQPATSLGLYRGGVARQPKEPIYDLKMADIYLSQNLKEEAFQKLQIAWGLHPENSKVLQQMGEDYAKVGRPDLAQQCFEEEKEMEAGKAVQP